MGNTNGKNLVECVKRTYRVQTSGGIKMEIESGKVLSGLTTTKLLEEDCEINSFLENCKIIDVEIPSSKVKKYYKKKAKPRKKQKIDVEPVPDIQDIEVKNRITPCDRINLMIAIGGEFTRIDYQKFMEDKGHKMSNFMGHEDIESAMLLRRIEPTGEKIGRGLRKYRITDTMPVEEYMFRKIVKNVKSHMKTKY